jgi:hypothetical protein
VIYKQRDRIATRGLELVEFRNCGSGHRATTLTAKIQIAVKKVLASLRQIALAKGAKLKVSAIACIAFALCGCSDDKVTTFKSCNVRARGNAIQTEKCMDEQGYIFSSSHLCAVSYPDVADECYEATWRSYLPECLRPEPPCGPVSRPYLARQK